ncbi:MAG: GHKL domain-containing protein [Bacteroidetes bacterium]|nr:GHKL domain-containing protein [Bacteroidota bacterium]
MGTQKRFSGFNGLFLCCLASFIGLIPDPALSQQQDIRFTHYSVETGLSQNSILDLVQDQTGFLWIATQDGLNRFDGFRFQIYRGDLKNENSLSGNHIRTFYLDAENNLWMGTYGGGISIFPAIGKNFIRITATDLSDSGLSDNFISKFHSDHAGRLWVGTRNGGLNLWKPETRSFRRFFPDQTISSPASGFQINDLSSLSNDRLIISTENSGLVIYNWKSGKSTQLNSQSKRNPLQSNSVSTVFSGTDSLLWIGTESGLILRSLPQFDLVQGNLADAIAQSPLKTARISQIFKDSGGTMWVGTNGAGLFRINPSDFSIKNFTSSINNPSGLTDNNIRSIYEDRNHNLWIGTYSGGLNKINETIHIFDHFKDNKGLNNSVVSIFESNDGSFILGGTFGDGIIRFDTKKNLADRIYLSGEPASTGHREVMSMLSFVGNKILAGTYNGMYVMDILSGKAEPLEKIFPLSMSFKGKKIRAITASPDGSYWIAAFGDGLYRFKPGTKEVTSWTLTNKPPFHLPDDELVSLLLLENNELLIGTYGSGLIRLNTISGQTTQYLSSVSDSASISSNFVLGMEKDKKGNVWIGSRDGLNIFNLKSGKFRHFHEIDGLSNNIVYSILQDSSNRVWVSTNNGITVITPKDSATFVLNGFDQSDGLQSNEFNTGAVFKVKTGYFYFGGINGITRFKPSQVIQKQTYSPLAITSLSIGNKRSTLDRNGLQSLSLPNGNNDFNVEFSVLEFINPARHQFSYMLDGYDKNWIQAGGRRFANYTNLPPGDYNFRIRATNYAGYIQDSLFIVPVQVSTPLWRTWYALTTYFLLIALVVYIFILAREKQLARENKILEEKIREKTAELTNRTHELENSYEQLRLSQSYLVQSEKMASLGTLVAGVAHEINNPVNFITSSIEPLRHDVTDIQTLLIKYTSLAESLEGELSGDHDPEKTKELSSKLKALKESMNLPELYSEIEILLKGIENGTHRTAEIVKSLRNFSRMDDKDKKLFDIHEGLESTIRILSVEFEKNRIEIVRNYNKIGLMDCYPGQLSQVFMNLLMNAVQALEGKSNGKIEITTAEADDLILITIQDNGPGIDKDIQNRIFDPFFTTKDVGKGTGMGLSISYSIIQKHKGTIQVISDDHDGTGFVITLPKHSL